MAIDSTLFAASVPAGTYAVGDKIPLSVIRGPAVVRDGYGAAKLKRIFTIMDDTQTGHIIVKNSNWIDEISNFVPNPATTVLSNNSNAIQPGHDADLQPNSGWEAYFIFDVNATTTAAFDLFAMIDIDYPAVQSVSNPKMAEGLPCSNVLRQTINVTGKGAGNALVWTTNNVDILKAGFRYLMSSVTFRSGPAVGFVSISGAASQRGLERIIPVLPNSVANLRYELDYSTPLVKGPFNINYAAVGTAGTDTAVLEIDWVKK